MTLCRPAAESIKRVTFCVLALAAASTAAQSRFTMSGDGQEVFDTSTQLTWRRCAEGMQWDGRACTGKPLKFSYAGAKQKAAGGTGAKAWRVPSRDELVGLVDMKAKKKPRIDGAAFPNTPSLPFWAARPGSSDNLNAWLVSFANGRVAGNVGQAKFPLRMVRTGS